MDLLGLMISIEMSPCKMKFEKHAYRKKSLPDLSLSVNSNTGQDNLGGPYFTSTKSAVRGGQVKNSRYRKS